LESSGAISASAQELVEVFPVAAIWNEVLEKIDRSMIHLEEYNLANPSDKLRLAKDFDLYVKAGTVVVVWDQFAKHILSDFTGVVKYQDLRDGQTMITKEDAQTLKSEKLVIEYKGSDNIRPRILITDSEGNTLTSSKVSEDGYQLPLNANLLVEDNAPVFAGQSLAKITKETIKTKDITGGLPRVSELFEVRTPKEVAVISEIDGYVYISPTLSKGKRRISVKPESGEGKDYDIPKSKHIIVDENDYVHSGDKLIDGTANPQDILAIRGPIELAKYIVDEVQKIYRGEGVHINDKHIEVIVRQMLRKVKVTNAGDTDLLVGESVDRQKFNRINAEALADGLEPATGTPQLQGITKASLSTESFISAASFQETTKVLTEAAVAGKVDHLTDLKANVIMGRLIPAGTGLHKYMMRIPKGNRSSEKEERRS
jgi:DNA-directed RNA polymerase subunit beta'